MNGRSQAIRLPKEFRVKGAEVQLKRVPALKSIFGDWLLFPCSLSK
jgi:hypothetical protein